MTKIERVVLAALSNMEEPATIRQIQRFLGCYVFSYVARGVQMLEAGGFIEPRDARRKAIRISEEGRVLLTNTGEGQ